MLGENEERTEVGEWEEAEAVVGRRILASRERNKGQGV